ncbi:hypothetical protein NDU88_007089 [Pleurodeles waltl]|uniref:Uncharacterized protein n=1 Tax=Pleurodeles waltl TaxID=8319 RepID=A0AAV7VR49_PLEWA|nr:hypothetical protein NDU88_007089 [Pleurodeles waltl]
MPSSRRYAEKGAWAGTHPPRGFRDRVPRSAVSLMHSRDPKVSVRCRRGWTTSQAGTHQGHIHRRSARECLRRFVVQWAVTASNVKPPLLDKVLGSRVGDAFAGKNQRCRNLDN